MASAIPFRIKKAPPMGWIGEARGFPHGEGDRKVGRRNRKSVINGKETILSLTIIKHTHHIVKGKQ